MYFARCKFKKERKSWVIKVSLPFHSVDWFTRVNLSYWTQGYSLSLLVRQYTFRVVKAIRIDLFSNNNNYHCLRPPFYASSPHNYCHWEVLVLASLKRSETASGKRKGTLALQLSNHLTKSFLNLVNFVSASALIEVLLQLQMLDKYQVYRKHRTHTYGCATTRPIKSGVCNKSSTLMTTKPSRNLRTEIIYMVYKSFRSIFEKAEMKNRPFLFWTK